MLAVCKREFRDLESGVIRKVGDTFETTPERLEAINGTKYGTLAAPADDSAEKAPQSAPEGTPAEPEKPKSRPRRTRKPKSVEEK